MTDNNLKNLPLGTSDFAALRLANEIYVDKTDLVYELASKRRKYFLARPRRFGKSLLISTFESLFRHGLRDFKGLAIEKLWIEESKPLVVRLDFSEIRECLTFCVCPKFITYVALRRGGSIVERSGTSEPPLRRFRSSHHSILA